MTLTIVQFGIFQDVEVTEVKTYLPNTRTYRGTDGTLYRVTNGRVHHRTANGWTYRGYLTEEI